MEIPQIYLYNLIILNSFWGLRLVPLLQPNSDAIVSHKTKKTTAAVAPPLATKKRNRNCLEEANRILKF